ncbi:unnamed protein product [Nesidiocoris tenuis]|uniref:DNA damage-binding protein 1 n=1 Tax=Nesidiocoris tenuis TaxID=355587 RepID=A0A6H5FZI9_9HEMI|nr:unnamed protein product [Nesidiocoris tenuis]
MFLYNLTLQRATGITHAVHGSFSGSKLQEILVSRGKILELLKHDPISGKVHSILTVEIFGVVRSLLTFRQTGDTVDYAVVGTDSGKVVILKYNPQKNILEKIHQETFGKSGCRRIVPGQYLAVEPKGRGFMVVTFTRSPIWGDDDDEPEFSSAMPLEEGDTFFFAPRPLLNLNLVDELDSLSPILDCQVADLANQDTPQLYMACGRGPRSTLRVLRHGLEVTQMAVSPLPGSPIAVWTVKKRADDEFDTFIIVSFVSATLVLRIGENVEEVADSGFHGITSTLACSLLGEDSAVQVHPGGVRHIRSDKRHQDWKAPSKQQIVKCAVNQRQVVIALTSGELVYFELDSTGHLDEYNRRGKMPADVVCMALGRAPTGENLSRFVAVGLADKRVQIISLGPADCLSVLSTMVAPELPESLCIVEMGGEGGGEGSLRTLYLNIGLTNGVLLRNVLDPVTGDLSDMRARYLGNRPVKLFAITMHGTQAVLAISSRSWLSYWYQNRFHLTPLSYSSLDYASGFSSDQCPEGIVAISPETLRILVLEKLGAVFKQFSFPLEYTPRKFAIHQESSNIVLIETDHNAYTEKTKQERRIQMAKEMEEAAGEEERALAKEMAEDFLSEDLPERTYGAPKAGAGMWASLIRIMDPVNGLTHSVTRLEQNEAAISLALVKFSKQPDSDCYLVVGVAKDYQLNPKQFSAGYLDTYKIVKRENGLDLELVHRTVVDGLPMAICPFHGRLLVGVGRLLRLYDLGKKKLLKKCENKHIPNMIVRIEAMGRRVYVSDVQESIFMVRYKSAENQLIIFADDTQPRWITTTTILDYNTVATADKFGNISVIRLPNNVTDDVDEDPTGNKALWDRGLLNGASQKADFVSNFHIGEVVTSLQKATLIPGGSESLVYTTLSGSVGVLVPFTSHEDQDFFQHLEMHMRSENPPLCGRDHLSFRSYYFPVKNVIDGDLCEQFNSLEPAKQKSISKDLEKKINDVSKKLEDIRTRYAF